MYHNRERFRVRVLVSPTKERQMKVTWRQLFGLSVAMVLLGSGVWANLGEGLLSQNKGAWVSHAIK